MVRAVVKLGRLRRFMVSDLLGVLDGAAVFQVSGNAGRPERMICRWLILRFGGSIGEYHLKLLCARHLWREFLRSRHLL